MPRFQVTRSVDTGDVSARRVRCDGCDPVRPCDEHADGPVLWLVTAGAFELRDTDGRHLIDPTRAIAMPAGHAFRVRHPAGPDTVVAFRGPIIQALLDRAASTGAHLIELAPAQLARLVTNLDGDDDLALAETIAALAPATFARPTTRALRQARALSAAICDVLRGRYAETTSLDELAEVTGYSVFHACHAFRAVTGTTIHGFRRELRLRHALARILDTREPLGDIAAATGFASQSHLTNQFRARFGVTPARARTVDGVRALRDQVNVG